MPPMDTGAIAIKITTDANLPIEKTQEVMERINKLMYAHDKEYNTQEKQTIKKNLILKIIN